MTFEEVLKSFPVVIQKFDKQKSLFVDKKKRREESVFVVDKIESEMNAKLTS